MKLKITEYELRDFKKEFNSKLRKKATSNQKFKQLKIELVEHLSKFEKDLTDLPDLKIYIENYSLCFSYSEVIGSPMTIRLIWKIVEMDLEKIKKLNETFSKRVGCDFAPTIQITNKFTHANYALYYPEDSNILISKQFIEQHSWQLVKSVIMHEILHHYCFCANLGASDTDEDFIRLLIKYKAYISKDIDAQKAYKDVLAKIVSEKIVSAVSENMTLELGS